MTTPEAITAVFQKHTEHKLQLEELMRLFPQVLPENQQTFDADKIENLINFIKNVVNHETGSMVVSRQLVNIVVSRLEGDAIEGGIGAYSQRCDPVESSLLKLALIKLLGVLQPRAISYEDQLAQVSYKLAGIFEREGNSKQAAFYLKNMNLEQAQRSIGEAEKCDIYLRTARLYLEAEEAEEAEKAINRVSLILQNKEKKDDESTLNYKALFARILDSRRRFLEAASRFYELANSQLLPQSDRMEALGNAITSVLLAPPGATRTRMLIQLYKDERSMGIKSFALLEKTYLCRIIKAQEIAEFENSLRPHQKTNEAGENIVRNVLLEHNVIAASRIYETISIKSLCDLLGLQTDEEAELVAAQMIADKRLDAQIDQIDSKIIFKHTNPLKKWDENIGYLCEQVSKVYDVILSVHPEFVQSIETKM